MKQKVDTAEAAYQAFVEMRVAQRACANAYDLAVKAARGDVAAQAAEAALYANARSAEEVFRRADAAADAAAAKRRGGCGQAARRLRIMITWRHKDHRAQGRG